jgi:uncharacterized protein (TIRG00374 family)
MKRNLILGVLISAVLLYFSIRGIDFAAVANGFKSVRCDYLAAAVVLLTLLQVVRSYRWGVILRPIKKIDQLSLFSITSVGFMALVAMPARIGELARPFLVKQRTGMRMTAAVGTVFIERILDMLTIMLIFFSVLFFVPLPPWLVNSSLAFLAITLVILIGMLLLIFKRESSIRIFERLTGIFPARLRARLNEMIHHFIDGIEMITDVKLILYATLLSMVIWALDVAAIYVLFLAFDLKLSLVAAVIVMVVLIIGITLPTAPGYIGNWHFFCMAGMTLFGASKADALAYAVMLHFVSVGIILVLGLIFLPFNKISYSDLTRGQT